MNTHTQNFSFDISLTATNHNGSSTGTGTTLTGWHGRFKFVVAWDQTLASCKLWKVHDWSGLLLDGDNENPEIDLSRKLH
jgi:hypothetical protein